MAWYRAGGAGIPVALKTGMNDVLNKKFGTSTTYAPNTWPDNVNLLGKLPEKTVSGAIAHIEDGADRVPVKAWGVTLNASLDGVSSLTCKQAKKNICTVLPWARDTHFWGSSWSEMVSFINTLPAGNYCVSYDYEITALVGDSIDVSYAPYIRANVDGTMVNITPYPTPQTDSAPTVGKTYHCQSFFGLTAATVGKIAYFYLYCGKTGSKVAEVTVKNAQIEVNSAATTYEAPEITTYTVNFGQTVHYGIADVVNGTLEPINILDSSTFVNGNLETISPQSTHNVVTQGFLPIKGNTAYIYTCTTGTNGVYFRFFDSRQTEIPNSAVNAYNATEKTFTTPSNAVYYRVMWYQSSTTIAPQDIIDRNVMIEKGSTATAYSPYFTPFTFTPITPPPETAMGFNNFWADEGDSQVTYRRDIDLALGGG